MLSDNFNLLSYINMRDQVSQTYKHKVNFVYFSIQGFRG
jgi:hypothetical protein